MAIKLRDNTATNTGKGSELTYLEMDTNLESFYFSSSLSGTDLILHTTGSDTHSIDLSGIGGGSGVQPSETGSFYYSSSVNLNTITFFQGDGSSEGVTVHTGSAVGEGTILPGTPAGSNTEVQFNDNGALEGATGFTYDKTNNTVTITSTGTGTSTTIPALYLASSDTAPTIGDVIGLLQAKNTFGSGDNVNAGIKFAADGTWSDGPPSYPTRIELQTGFGTGEVTRVTIKADGKVGIGNLTPPTALTVQGDISASGDLYAAGLDNTAQINVVGYNTTSGKLTYFPTTSLALNYYNSNYDVVETLNNDIIVFIDSNYGTSPIYERILNDDNSGALPSLDEINGRTLMIDQSNTTEGTLRFGFGSWQGTAGRKTFTTEIYNRGSDTFKLGAFLPTGTWKVYLQGHDSGGGDVYQTYDTTFTGNATFYTPHAIREGAYVKVFYDFLLKVIIIWSSSWTGTLGGNGLVNL